MLIGKREIFAVECAVENVVDGWWFGHFFLWVDGFIVGNRSDNSVDIKGCLNWFRDLIENPRNRYEPDLYEMHKEQVFLRIASSVLMHEDRHGFVEEFYEDTFHRFHISHIGMASFDRVTLLFIKSEEGGERLIWNSGDEEIRDAFLGAGEVEKVLLESIVALEEKIVDTN